ncbi:Serine/threonine-protein kinase PLK4 [Portunus trituberculatus]|uniref:Serine/threonine-protein kinase PLK4 n=1 Tax=Portunus trituberculatus TaxID=210409 RepID=A0A5B7FGW0_PORTR|nr:Serine/threonine-protein kinase PLK4 [Portunus trituberculatus]
MVTLSSPRDLLPPNAGVIDSLKRKFTPLPSLRRGEDFAFPPPSHPLPPRKERDVYEERHRQHPHHHQPSDTRHYSSSSYDDNSSHGFSSSASNTARDKHTDHRGAGHGYDKSRKKSRSLERDILPRNMSSVSGGYYSGAVQRGYCQTNYASMESTREECSTQQSQSSEHTGVMTIPMRDGMTQPRRDTAIPAEAGLWKNNCQTLRQQVSPLTSKRLRKVRYRSNKYFLNILENGEVCLEHLSGRHTQELVDDVCRISPDGLRIVIYRPNGGSGAVPGESPVPLPEEGADLIYSYENLPSKYWTKYKAAARFVKLLRSRTTKITYYSDQAKFYLMENSPNPDFVGHFYHGTKITQSNNSVVVREASGASHTRQLSAASQAFPVHLHPLLKHFKEVQSHCLNIEQVLDDLACKTELTCFPAIMGSKPPAASSPPVSTRSRGHPTYDKENLSPSSLQSFRSPHNIMAQLGSFEGSLASIHVGGAGGGMPPAIRLPLNPHSSNAQLHLSEQPKTSSVRVYVQNIGWASKGSSGEVLVEYLDGSRVQVSSNSPKVVFTETSGASTTYSVKDNLPLVLKEKLAQMETVLDCLAQSTVPKASHMDHR